jgi:hypothetical protein
MFAVEMKWFNSFVQTADASKGYSVEDEIFSIDPINNTTLLKDKAKYIGELLIVKKKLKADVDYQLVS